MVLTSEFIDICKETWNEIVFYIFKVLLLNEQEKKKKLLILPDTLEFTRLEKCLVCSLKPENLYPS